MSDEQAKAFFPDKGSLTGTTYEKDKEKFDRESTENIRVQHQYRKALQDIEAKVESNPQLKAMTKAERKKAVQAQITAAQAKQDQDEPEAPTELELNDRFGGISI